MRQPLAPSSMRKYSQGVTCRAKDCISERTASAAQMTNSHNTAQDAGEACAACSESLSKIS